MALLGTSLLCLGFVGGCVSVDKGRADRERLAAEAAEAGDWVRAGELWHELYQRDGGREVTSSREMARALLARGDAQGALAVLRPTLDAHPDQPELLVLAARAHLALTHEDAAASALERALEADPDRLDALRRLGELRLQRGESVAAVDLFQRAAALDPPSRDLAWLLARAHEDAGEMDEALVIFSGLLDGASTAPVEALLHAARVAARVAASTAEGAVRQSAIARAEGWLVQAVRLDPQETEAHRLLGVIQRGTGDTDAAFDSLSRAAELDPTDADVLEALAQLLSERGEKQRARAMLERAQAVRDQSGSRTRP